MRQGNRLAEVVPVLVILGRQKNLDDLSPEDFPAVVRNADEINRLHWSAWDAVTSDLSTDDLMALFQALVVAERVLGWAGGSVAAPIWVFRALKQREEALSWKLADWALAHTRNEYVPFGTANLGARSLADMAERQKQWAEHRAEIAAQESRRAEEGARRRAARRQAHQQRAVRQQEETAHRREILAQMEALAPSERLRRIAEAEEFPVSFFPEAFAEVSDRDLETLDSDALHRLTMRTAESGLPGWKRLHQRLLKRDE